MLMVLILGLLGCAPASHQQYYQPPPDDACLLLSPNNVESAEILLQLTKLERETKEAIQKEKGNYNIETYYSNRDKLVKYIDDRLGKYSHCSEVIVKRIEDYKTEINKLDEDFKLKLAEYEQEKQKELVIEEESKELEQIAKSSESTLIGRFNFLKGAGYQGFSSKNDDILIEIVDFKIYDESTYFELRLTVISNNIIIKPKTYEVSVSLEEGTEMGHPYPTGFFLSDNFGNLFNLKEIEPRYFRFGDEIGIKPGESKIFKIWFADTPIESTDYLTLSISSKTFNNSQQLELVIPHLIIENR